MINQYRLKNFQYQFNIILLKLSDKFYHEIRLSDFQENRGIHVPEVRSIINLMFNNQGVINAAAAQN